MTRISGTANRVGAVAALATALVACDGQTNGSTPGCTSLSNAECAPAVSADGSAHASLADAGARDANGDDAADASVQQGHASGTQDATGADATFPPGAMTEHGDAGAGRGASGEASIDGFDAGSGGGSDFTTYLANAAHTNSIDDPTLAPPLRQLWTVVLPQPIEYPLVVGDLVYVTTLASGQLESSQMLYAQLLAFDLRTGAPVWTGDLGAVSAANIVYDNGRVFVVEYGNGSSLSPPPSIRAFDALTGAPDWQVEANTAQSDYSVPPVVYDGTLYVSGLGPDIAAQIYAYDETSGTVRWSQPFNQGLFAASDDGLFAFDACGGTTALNLDGGAKWSIDAGACAPGGDAVLDGHILYETLSRATNARLDARTGALLGTFADDFLLPAFGDGLELDNFGVSIQAVSIASGANVWTFTTTAEGRLQAPGLVVGSTIYVASSPGTIYAIDAATGTVVWSDSFSVPSFAIGTFGMAAAHGVLVVPVDGTLVAYVSAGNAADAGSDE